MLSDNATYTLTLLYLRVPYEPYKLTLSYLFFESIKKKNKETCNWNCNYVTCWALDMFWLIVDWSKVMRARIGSTWKWLEWKKGFWWVCLVVENGSNEWSKRQTQAPNQPLPLSLLNLICNCNLQKCYQFINIQIFLN